MVYSVLIAGLGQIGLGYDLDQEDARFVLTHSRAFSMDPCCRVDGGVDPDPEKRLAFERRYRAPAYPTVPEAVARCAPDIVVVAVPTAQHATLVRDIVAAASPRAILCEKPLAYDPAEAAAIVGLCEASDVALFVNYMRRADPSVKEIRARVADGRIKGPVRGVAWYSKGMLNSASHIVDLCCHWFGPVGDARRVPGGSAPEGDDPRIPFMASFGESTMSFLPVDRPYFFNAIECLAENGRLHYELSSAAVEWQPVCDSVAYAGYRTVDPRPETIPTDLHRVQQHVVAELVATLEGASGSLCTGREALVLLTHLNQLRTPCS